MARGKIATESQMRMSTRLQEDRRELGRGSGGAGKQQSDLAEWLPATRGEPGEIS